MIYCTQCGAAQDEVAIIQGHMWSLCDCCIELAMACVLNARIAARDGACAVCAFLRWGAEP